MSGCKMSAGMIMALAFFLFFLRPAKGFTLSASSCATLMCRPGRECRQQPGSAPHCACVLRCPEHWKPVCGSDGESYDNHCLLHRAACLSGAPVSPLHPGFCRKERKIKLELEDWRQHQTTSSPPPSTPSACLQKDRDDLRSLIQHWFLTHNASETTWQRIFSSLDSNDDGFLDSEEMFSRISSDKMSESSNMFHIDSEMMAVEKRQLCVDALVEEGDINLDWRLNVQEFSQLFDSSYIPSDKSCNLNGLDYQDGRTTSLECNSCVCACGKWICTSEKCPQHSQLSHHHHLSPSKNAEQAQGLDYYDEEEDDDESEEDEEYSEEDYDIPEDDPDVKDIRWF